MKSILFVIPWSGFYIGNSDDNFADGPDRAPEGVVGLATYLQAHGARVQIADMQQMLRCNRGDDSRTREQLWAICRTFRPDVVGFSFFTARFAYAQQLYAYLAARYAAAGGPRPLMLAGGVHPTLLPHVTLRHIPFDALVIGEGERPLLRLLRGEPPARIKGFCLPGQARAEKADVITDLDELPFPDWNLVDWHFYTQPSHQISNTVLHRVMPVTFGRGCLYRCNFCAHNCFLHARCHSPAYFVAKLDHVARLCGVNTFIIQDSSIGNFRTAWEEVCRRLIDRGSPYRWWGNLRANQAEPDLLQLMKRAGCIKLFFGFESGSQRVLDRMNKRITVGQCRRAARLCHEAGLPFYTSYIINYFGEQEADLELTEQLIRDTRPTSLAVNKFSPVPGSADYDNHTADIAPLMRGIADWTALGMLNAPLLFGDMPPERFTYWHNRLRHLKTEINNHETAAE